MTIGQSLAPKIYVASLTDYNAGRLHGRWIDATQGVEGVFDEIEAMSAVSHEKVGEEFAIHDYEDFGGARLGEYEDLARVCEIADAVVKHGNAFGAWYTYGDWEHGRPLAEQFEDVYCGEFDDLADYAEETALEMGEVTETHLGLWPFTCIDWERAGRELQYGGDVWTADAPVARCYVFRTG